MYLVAVLVGSEARERHVSTRDVQIKSNGLGRHWTQVDTLLCGEGVNYFVLSYSALYSPLCELSSFVPCSTNAILGPGLYTTGVNFAANSENLFG